MKQDSLIATIELLSTDPDGFTAHPSVTWQTSFDKGSSWVNLINQSGTWDVLETDALPAGSLCEHLWLTKILNLTKKL